MFDVRVKALTWGDEEFHQKCRVGPDLFKRMGNSAGSFVEIDVNGVLNICSLWINQDLESDIFIYNNTVYCHKQIEMAKDNETCSKTQTYDKTGKICERIPDKIVPGNDIQNRGVLDTSMSTLDVSCNMFLSNKQNRVNKMSVLNTVKASEVCIEVILYKLTKVKEYKANEALIKQMQEYCSNLLLRFCVKPGFLINSSASRLAKYFGISHIIVKNATMVDSGNVERGKERIGYLINRGTRINIESIHSKDWFEQISSPRSALSKPGGLDSVIQMLLDLIRLPFERRDQFKQLGTRPPRGVLLCGPPGCGKTSIVRYVCAMNKFFLVTINGPEIFGPRPGETEGNMRRIFSQAKLSGNEGPCVLFIDEIDSLCSSRSRACNPQETRATNQFLLLMDDLGDGDNILVIGATNRPSALDPALRRPGRLDREVIINPPTCQERADILSSLMSDIPRTGDLHIKELAEMTNGYVGADLASLCSEASYLAMSESVGKCSNSVRQQHFLTAFKTIRPSLQKGTEGVVDLRPVYWSDIGGLDTVKTQIQQAVEWPLKHPEAFERMGLKPPKGVLLYGPPGCCKTTLVRAAATACHSTFLSLSGAQLYSAFVGDSEKLVSEVFQKARACAPSILFLDELDSIVGKRSESGHAGVQDRILSTLLNEMDGIGVRLNDGLGASHQQKVLEGDTTTDQTDAEVKVVDNRSVLVVAATNRPDLIDDALMRPGRMDRVIYVQHPDRQARLDILKLYTKNMQLLDCDLDLLAEKTDMYTGADLESLCREAALFALSNDINTSLVTMEQFEKALKVVPPSLTNEMVGKYSNFSAK